MMTGRRALPYSAEAEDQLTPSAGRHKLLWRDRPKHFPTLAGAMTFAAHRARATQARQRVRLEVAGGHCWTVRPTAGSVVLIRSLPLLADQIERQLRASLRRMERWA